MSDSVIAFIRISLFSLVVGVILGVLMAAGVFRGAQNPSMVTSAHAHVNLLGFMSMLIFGVGYHILPRFSGKPLYSESLASAQVWVNLVGLVGIVGALLVGAYTDADLFRYGVAPFGVVFAAGALIFAYNLLKTMSGPAPAPVVPPRAKAAAKTPPKPKDQG